MLTDIGTWIAEINPQGRIGDSEVRRVFLSSDDFSHDVLMEVNGDFESIEDQLQYAQNLADRLNATKPQDA